jgi:glutamate racemase
MIGIFDSGIGGLTVVRALMKALPGYDMLYFGDTARTPYGTKSADTISAYAVQNSKFLIQRGARVIVVACNTASSVAMASLRRRISVPIFEVVTPAVSAAIEVSSGGRIGVIGTRATINSGIYERKLKALQPDVRVYSAACPLLVPLVEEGWFSQPETARIVKKCLLPLKVRQIDTLILACTHYPLLKAVIRRKAGRRVQIIDSSLCLASAVHAHLQADPLLDGRLGRCGRFTVYVSDITAQFRNIARQTLHRRVALQPAGF